MLEQGFLDLAARDHDAARLDDVLHAIDDEQIALVVEIADVAGMEPAAGEGLLRLLRLVPVFVQELRRAMDDLAVHAGRAIAHVGIDDARLRRRGSDGRRMPGRASCSSGFRMVASGAISVWP